jgi:exopolysaccharide biosynthesis polyprenyl glycosylphosphotransferase
MFTKFKKILLLGGDIFFLYASLYLALTIRYASIPDKTILEKHLTPFTFIFAIWIVVFFVYNLYHLNLASQKTAFYRYSLRSFATAGLISIIYFYIAPQTEITPKTNLVIFIAVFAAIFFLWRKLYYTVLRSYIPKDKVAVIGETKKINFLVNELTNNDHPGYKISFIIDPLSKEKQPYQNIPVFHKIEELPNMINKKNINTLVLASDPTSSADLRNMLFSSLHLKINFITLPQFYENITGKIPLGIIDQIWFLQNLSEGGKAYFDAFKRSYDLIIATLILIASVPLWPFIIVAIKLTDRGPIFFKQTRAGQYGRPFQIFKFRTMTDKDNDQTPTREKDQRITKVGSFLRKSRLDEIPQVINVLKGEMSFVGPRPERPELIKDLEKNIPFYRERMLVKPGITGWDQISGEYHSPSLEDTWKKLQYDLFYIKNRSVYLDLSIILKTVSTIVGKTGR